MVVLGGGAVSQERGTPVNPNPQDRFVLSKEDRTCLTLHPDPRSHKPYRGTSPIGKRPPPENSPGTLGIGQR